jgi:hypothetical protein
MQDNQSLRVAQSGVSQACQGLDPEFTQDWTHVLDFFIKYTSPGAGTFGDLFTDALESRDSPQASAPAEAAQLVNLREDIADIQDRLSSKAITIDSYISPSSSRLLLGALTIFQTTPIKPLSARMILLFIIVSVASSRPIKTLENLCIRTRRKSFFLLH